MIRGTHAVEKILAEEACLPVLDELFMKADLDLFLVFSGIGPKWVEAIYRDLHCSPCKEELSNRWSYLQLE